eukprot:Sdes_comp23668_c0_seq1m21846
MNNSMKSGSHRLPIYQGSFKNSTQSLQNAIITGDFPTVEAIINLFPNHIDDELSLGWTPLIFACYHGRSKIVQFLLQKGVDPQGRLIQASTTPTDEFHVFNFNPLFAICLSKKETTPQSDVKLSRTAALLISCGASINIKDTIGQTPLMKAIINQRFLLAKLLIQQSDTHYINTKDIQGRTALMFAAEVGDMETIKMLLHKAADTTSVDDENLSILHYSKNSENEEVYHYLYKITNITMEKEVLASHEKETTHSELCPQSSICKESNEYWENFGETVQPDVDATNPCFDIPDGKEGTRAYLPDEKDQAELSAIHFNSPKNLAATDQKRFPTDFSLTVDDSTTVPTSIDSKENTEARVNLLQDQSSSQFDSYRS